MNISHFPMIGSKYKLLALSYKNLRNKKTMSYIPKNRLQGKVAVVTASTDGIGFAIAQRLAQEGAKVVVSSRKQENVNKAMKKLTSSGLNVIGTTCHVASDEDRKKLIAETVNKFGSLDILVSNAAVNPFIGNVLDCEEKQWDKIFEVNVKASYLLAQEALPHIRKSGAGRIVFISSAVGFQTISMIGAYAVSKTSLFGLTKAAAVSLAKENITVNCVAPGLIKTNFSDVLINTKAGKEAMLALIPMKRFGTPEDISGVVAFLVSDDARYITGETIVAAGGFNSRL